MDALKFIVRGFGSQEVGKKICDYLEEQGFSIEEAIDGESDSMGGIIETNICPVPGTNELLDEHAVMTRHNTISLLLNGIRKVTDNAPLSVYVGTWRFRGAQLHTQPIEES